MFTSSMIGLGTSLPPATLSNEALIEARHIASSDQWIRIRTGIQSRHLADRHTSTSDLAVAAGRAALASAADLAGSDATADMVILATTTPDHRCPSTAPEISHRLGLGHVPAVDLSAACSGFLYALVSAHALVATGLYSRILVIGAETYTTTLIDPRDRDTAILFGDGAGAVLVAGSAAYQHGAILATELGSDGAGVQGFYVPAGGSRRPLRQGEQVTPGDHFVSMDGRNLYMNAVRRMTEAASSVLKKAGWSGSDIEVFVGHQANQRILDSVAERLDLPADRQFGNLRVVGNTAAASIPLALADAASRGAVNPGDRTILTAFGAGYTWGAAALTFPAAVPYQSAPHATEAPRPVITQERELVPE